ncbi:hypothetical protein BDB00DRAFT_926882 [Zychaea mexicana]|uniref:uncharacterized protein n=1 Tax=Zychaea mexicana TaxID=64656 RepID=UPI0022FEBD87|nr:uncharacterized protein BDB00DRAFT_926882 [Zychaea mexicana]KAI9496332.1 hypothetical protein BDB00DRAFT_926882 [Zychaea mexicana]
MSSPPPKHSLSSPTNSGNQTPVLPTPSCSSSASEVHNQLRRELEQQIAEKEKQLQDSSSGIGKGVLNRQIKQLKERLQEMDRRQKQATQAQPTASSSLSPRQQLLGTASPSSSATKRSQSPASASGDDDLSPATLEKLRNLERDLGSYRGYQQLSPNLSGHRKDKLLGQRTGLDPLPSPSTSTMLPPPQGHDSTSLLPLPPPPTGSTPTKRRSKVPNADRRNTDIEFATEIGQGLLIEVRKMQALLQEKDDQLKALQAQKADLERAAESMAKQLRQKEENEEKLKEETWNLELAKQELTISVTELQQNLNKANAEQKRMQEHMDELTTEIEHMRDREEKLSATLEAMKQRHEQDMGTIRRHSAGLQREKTDHIKQIEALSSELAIAKAQSKIAKRSHSDLRPAAAAEKGEEKAESATTPAKEGTTPGSSPPPSPKQTPTRNQQLEVETLKTSLAHAHRMVNNLRSNLHREKTEKFELKKLLTESQETIEQLQNDPRLWVDAGYPKSGTGSNNAPDSTGSTSTRRLRKGKRRVPVSKTRVARIPKGGESLDDSSDVEERRKRKDSQQLYYSSQGESEEDDDDDEYYEDADEEPSGTTAGFTSLDSELSKSQQKQQQQKRPPTVSVEPPTPVADNAPRTLGDELSAAFAGPDTADTEPRATGSDAGVQTEDTSANTTAAAAVAAAGIAGIAAVADADTPAAVFHEIAIQTDPADFQEFSMPATDIAPVTVHDQEVQCVGPAIVHAETQCVQPEYIEHGIQSEPAAAAAVDASAQYEPAATHDQGVQHEFAGGIDQFTQSDVADAVNAGVQSETASISDAFCQSEPEPVKETNDVSVQSEPEPVKGTSDVSVQSEPEPVKDTSDMSVQSEPEPVKDTSDMSVQSEPEPVKDTNDVSVQSEPELVKETNDVSVQSDVPVAKEISVQSEPPVTKDMFVQHENDLDEGVDVAVQTEFESPSSSSAAGAGALAAGGALGGLGALAAKAFGGWGNSDDAKESAKDNRTDEGDDDDKQTSSGAAEKSSTTLEDVSKSKSPEETSRGVKDAVVAGGIINAATPVEGDAQRLANGSTNEGQCDANNLNDAIENKQAAVIDLNEQADRASEEASTKPATKAAAAAAAAAAVAGGGGAATGAASATVADATAGIATDDSKTSPADSATDLHKLDDHNDDDSKMFTKEETDAMIEAAVAAAVTKSQQQQATDGDQWSVENSKRHTDGSAATSNTIATKPSLADLAGRDSISSRHDTRDIPARPTSPPPAHLLSRVGQGSTISSSHRSSIGSISTADKGKTPARSQMLRNIQHNHHQQQHQRPPSSLSSMSASEPRVSIASSPYATSLRTEGDPAHIGLITQTMIGDWLWKYTRKTVGGALSDHRHKRYFWIHPYTRTLYWSTRAPGSHGDESKAKSARIEGVSAVPDHNHPPSPDVPNMSLLIQTANRVIKLTAPNMDRHNVWYEALSYLVSRPGGNVGTEKSSQPKDAASSNGGARGLVRKPSIQRVQNLFRSGSKTEISATTAESALSNRAHTHDHDHDDDYDTEDEALEDVRMCCDGKHHVSKLERDHVDHRPYYRKIRSLRSPHPGEQHEHHQPQPQPQPQQVN